MWSSNIFVHRAFVGGLLLGVSVWFSACEGLVGPSRLEQEIVTEQKAIVAYDQAIPAVDRLGAEFAAAWTRANHHTDPRMLRDDLKAHALPAGDAHLGALKAMPVQSDGLRAVHEPLVAARAQVVAALRAFAESPIDGEHEALFAPVEAAFVTLRSAENDYRRGLETWYAKNRTGLVAPFRPAASMPPPAAP